jgi:hypothetical protein
LQILPTYTCLMGLLLSRHAGIVFMYHGH